MLAAGYLLNTCSTLLPFVAAAALTITRPARSAPVVWSGLSVEFTKSTSTPADQITENVALSRGSTRGLFNAEIDKGYNGSGPSDTEWATDLTSGDEIIAASNWEALTFDSWLKAYGGNGQVGHQIEDRDAVVHLITDDIYLDLRFTNWQSSGGGGGFTYRRATGPTAPEIPGDYNQNGVVDAADYTLWRDTFGQNVTPGTGADGDSSGSIGPGDYGFWKSHFGQLDSGAGAGASHIAVAAPEPTSRAIALMGLGLLPTYFFPRLHRALAQRSRKSRGGAASTTLAISSADIP